MLDSTISIATHLDNFVAHFIFRVIVVDASLVVGHMLGWKPNLFSLYLKLYNALMKIFYRMWMLLANDHGKWWQQYLMGAVIMVTPWSYTKNLKKNKVWGETPSISLKSLAFNFFIRRSKHFELPIAFTAPNIFIYLAWYMALCDHSS